MELTHAQPFQDLSQSDISKILSRALERGGDFADLFCEYRAAGSFQMEDGVVRNSTRGVVLGSGVRVLKGWSTGYAYTESFDLDRVLTAATTASAIAESGSSLTPNSFSQAVPANNYPVEVATFDQAHAQKLDIIRRIDKSARAMDSRIVKVDVVFVEEAKHFLIATSEGKFFTDFQPLFRLSVSAIAQDGDKRQVGSAGGGGRLGFEYFDTHSPEATGEKAAQMALTMLDAKEAPAGEFDVVLAPADSGILLHEAIGHGLEADFNRKKTSNYTDCIGKQVASELCTVTDDGTVKHSRGSINVDDEGNAPKNNVLIEKGILVNYMHDHLSAKYFDTEASGNGRRQSFRHIPMPRMTNTCMLAGDHNPEEIIGSVQNGIYAKTFSGGQVNISNGDFVFSLTEGYLIEDGKLTAPLKGVNLIGNGPEALMKVTMVGNDYELSDGMWTCGKEGQSVPVGVGTPTVKIAGMTVGGTQQ